MQEILDRLAQMDAKFDRMDAEVRARFDGIDSRLDRLDGRQDRIDDRLGGIDDRLDQIDGQLHKHGLLLESMDGTLKMTMEVVVENRRVLDEKFADVLTRLDERVQPLEAASRHLASRVAESAGPKPKRREGR